MYKRLVIPSVPISPVDLIGDPDRRLEQKMWDTNIRYYTQDVPKPKNKSFRITFKLPSKKDPEVARGMGLSIYDALVNSGYIGNDEEAVFYDPECVVAQKAETVIDIWGE